MGRRLEDTIIIDNSPNSYQFQPENGIPIISWYDDPDDRELMKMIAPLSLLADDRVDDVRPVILASVSDNNEWSNETAVHIC